MRFEEKTAHFACFSLFSQAEIVFPIWMNNFLNEYFLFNFELNIELNQILARFNVKMNNQNVSVTPSQLCLWQCFCWAIKMAFTCGLASQVNLFKRPFSATFKAVQADMPEVVCCKANFGKQGFWKCLKCAPYCNKAQVYPLTPVPC